MYLALEKRVGNGSEKDEVVHPNGANSRFQQDALKYLDSLYNFAMHLTKHPSEADDLVQETYLRAFRFQHRFELGTRMREWLFQIMRNVFLNSCIIRNREAAVAESGIPDWDIPMFYNAPVYDSSAMEVHTDLERAMRRIPEEFRAALLLAEVEGMPLEDIARVMACPVGTVKSRISRAKNKLRALLREYYGEYDGHDRIPAKRVYNGAAIDAFA